jgi:hypothetical protein
MKTRGLKDKGLLSVVEDSVGNSVRNSIGRNVLTKGSV